MPRLSIDATWLEMASHHAVTVGFGSSAATLEIQAAIPGKRIVILNMWINNRSVTATNITWKCGSTALTGALFIAATSSANSVRGGEGVIFCPDANASLNWVNSTPSAVAGFVNLVFIDSVVIGA